MAEKKRQCGTCRFFIKNEQTGTGKCSHPLRAGADAELLLLRPNELACRTKWGDSLWQDEADDSDPTAPKAPQQPTLPEPIAAQLQFDDEVTSVSIAGSKNSRSSFEDDVVDSGATATGMASWNDPVQDERLSLLRRGNHDALAGARKRHMDKQARQRELVPFAEDEEVQRPVDEPKQESSAPQAEAKPKDEADKPVFPPDDFVETERSSNQTGSTRDDEMVDDGVTSGNQRSPRLRKLMRDSNDPKNGKAMQFSMPSEMRVTSHNPEQREQWNSVPAVNPNFELPLSKPAEQTPPTKSRVAASAAPMVSSSYQPRPVSQARELLSEDRLRLERAQRHVTPPLAEEPGDVTEPTSSPRSNLAAMMNDRPRLSEPLSRRNEPIDQIKKSPLRGYHPAPRKEAPAETPTQEQRAIQPARRAMREQQETSTSWNLQQPEARSRQVEPHRQQIADQQAPQQQAPRQRPEPAVSAEAEVVSEQAARPRPRRIAEQAPVEAEQKQRPYIPLHDVMDPYEKEPIEISPDVPRQCSTCASYRPSSTPGRGSCSNQFAGPVDRVVSGDDYACDHTFGSFWIPADRLVWRAKIKTEYPPTPRIERMIARRERMRPTVLPDLDELTS